MKDDYYLYDIRLFFVVTRYTIYDIYEQPSRYTSTTAPHPHAAASQLLPQHVTHFTRLLNLLLRHTHIYKLTEPCKYEITTNEIIRDIANIIMGKMKKQADKIDCFSINNTVQEILRNTVEFRDEINSFRGEINSFRGEVNSFRGEVNPLRVNYKIFVNDNKFLTRLGHKINVVPFIDGSYPPHSLKRIESIVDIQEMDEDNINTYIRGYGENLRGSLIAKKKELARLVGLESQENNLHD